MKNHFHLHWFLIFLFFPLFLNAQLRVAKVFSDNMVLQRDKAIPVWGWANAGETITVTFNEQGKKTTASEDGAWKVELEALSAGGPFEMKIKDSKEEIILSNILMGDVWICSGQSNMAWSVKNSNNPEEEIANAKDSKIRHFTVSRKGSEQIEKDLPGGTWEVCSSETAGEFTAVGYYFARALRANNNVPIGLLNTSWGGSRVEAWMSAEALGESDAKAALEKIKTEAKVRQLKKLARLKKRLGYIPKKDEGLKNGLALWAAKDFDDSRWGTMPLPGLWEQHDLKTVDGIVWFRKTIELSETDVSGEIRLGLGKIDDSDQTWINGQKVGEMIQQYNQVRAYRIPANTLKSGKNVITVRVEDTGGGGGIYGDSEWLFIKTNAQTISLAGDWKFRVGELFTNSGMRTNHTPTLLYNYMINPILDFPIKGAIWYQGESNANGQDAYQYRDLFSDMIIDWRKRWKVGDFPFLFVQLANFKAIQEAPSESDWAVLRESQSETLKQLPNTGQAVIIDIGEADDIHPRNKQDVGLRLSLAARKLAYGEEIVHSGPTYKDHKVGSKRIRIHFENAGGGLVAKGSETPGGFAIAGADKKFVWANTKIDGNDVVVWSDEVPNPVAVRYAWADNPHNANLYNKEGLPACPFRTDDW